MTDVDPIILINLSEISTETCFAWAFTVLLLYDTLIMMDKEIKYFWVGLSYYLIDQLFHSVIQTYPMTTVHTIYFANRYLGLLCAIAFVCWNTYDANAAFCNFAAWTRNAISWLILTMFDYILMMRVLALYSRDKKLSRYLQGFLVVEASLSLAITIYATQLQNISAFRLFGNVVICGESTVVPLGWGIADWSISAVYGFVLLVLALYKAIKHWRLSAGLTGVNLVKLLVRDQIIYFFLIILVCIFNIMQFKVVASNVILGGILEGLGNPVILCIAGSRMLINLKEAGERIVTDGTYCLEPLSTVQFVKSRPSRPY